MASIRDIRRRIRSVKGTAQITKAMQMVASSKMRKAQQAAVNGRPFAELAGEVMAHATGDAGDFSHPLIEPREVRRRGVILVSTDKGLCGALNSNLFREVARYDAATTSFIAVGKKAGQFLARTRRKLVAEFGYHDTPTYGECQAISRCAKELFLNGEVDQIEVVYSRFVNTLSQKPDTRLVLPMGDVTTAQAKVAGRAAATGATATDYLFEPSAPEVMEVLLAYLLDFQIAQLLLESKASEHSARMVAMKNATENAEQLIKDLTLESNKMRQASITKELLEIATAQMAIS
ncbi:MAG: ATP synthase F1 subunit gamma [Verrucomicrobiales bacterium]|nr:ATP synthase F1 subunit gamma [Verrucomicrobiales bacterium]